jgi:hypothetical protein
MAEKKKSKKEKIDPYFLSNGKLRSEFSPDFEEKRSKIITPEGLYGTASGKTMFESEVMSPDDSMLMQYQQDGGLMNQPQKKIQKAYLGKAIRQPTETDKEFEMRHEYHTPFKGPQKAQDGGLMDQPHLNYMGAAKGKFIAKGCGKVMSNRRKVTKMY